MAKWVECIPNFSEGRRPEVVEQILVAIRAVPGVYLLDREMDPDHNRVVVTFVGEPDVVKEAAFAGIAASINLIDLNHHKGAHPRMGAADVCPFVPLSGSTMEDCVAVAKELGERVGRELHIPVYLYEDAATVPERKNLSNVRKGEFEKLKELIGTDPSRNPDFGPCKIHPTAGAIAIGARFFLVAFNVNLRTQDLAVAKKIACEIREKDGGFPAVKAMGFDLAERKMVQVSMNLTDYRKTSPYTVFKAIHEKAKNAGVEVEESEIIGLIPREALENVVVECLKVKDFKSSQVIENRIGDIQQDPLTSVAPFLEELASSSPAPGGGSASALAGAMSAALASMVLALTLENKKFAGVKEELSPISERVQKLRKELETIVSKDTEAFNEFMKARKMPKETDAEKEARDKAILNASIKITLVPLNMMKKSLEILEILPHIAEKGNPHAITDIGVAAHLATASVEGGALNVMINLPGLKDEAFKEQMKKEMNEALDNASSLKGKILDIVKRHLF